MNLKTSFPKNMNESDSEIIFSLPSDIDRKTRRIDGHLVCTKKEIFIYIDGEIKEKYKISDFNEFECERLIGCSMLVGKKLCEGKNGESYYDTTAICAFTQTHFLRYAELAKILEFYNKNGKLITATGEEEPSCLKCGLPLDGAAECPFCTKKSSVLLKLIKRAGPYKKYFIIAVACTIITELLWLINPYLEKVLVDKYITPKYEAWGSFLVVCIGIVGVNIIAWILEYFNFKTSFRVALSVGRDLRSDVFTKAQHLSMKAISKRSAGELINRVSNDAMKLQDFITANGKDAIVKCFSLVILMIVIFTINVRLAIFVILPVPFVAFIVIKLFNVMSIRYGRVWRMMTRHASFLHDTLNGIRVVKSFGSESKEIDKYKDASLNWSKAVTNADIIWYLTVPMSWFLMSVGNFFVLYFGGEMVLGHELSLGELVQYTSYVGMLYGPMEWLIQLPRILADTSVSASRVFEILEERSDTRDTDNSKNVDIKGDIEFDGVSFGYKVYNPVLKDVSLKINAGEMVGIVGHSGVGKSTMINLILRLYDCTQGSIKFDGVDIKDISQQCLRRQIGVVLQETFLFDGSVYDNIRYAKQDATFEEIIRAAKIANAHDFIVKLPDGYNTRVGEKGFSLSGGERQRIAIARAILHNPKILILDEATASLDTQTEKQIQDALDKLIEGRTVIAIAHRLSTLSGADRLIVLDKGKLAEIGTHENLMRKQGVYYKLVMAQRQTTKMKKVKTEST